MAAAAKKQEEKGTPRLWISRGERYLTLSGESKPKLVHIWSAFRDGAVAAEEMIFGGRHMAAPPGAVYCVRATGEEAGAITVHGGKGEYRRHVPAAELKDVAEWEALETAARAAAAVDAEERKAARYDSFEELLAPIARAYAKGSPKGRQAILLRVIDTIRKQSIRLGGFA